MVIGRPAPADDLAARAAEVVRAGSDLVPRAAVVLGSGLGPALGDHLREHAAFEFGDLPWLRAVGGPGPRRAAAARDARRRAGGRVLRTGALLRGARHGRPGHASRLARALGCSTIVVTAAVGALVPELVAGSVVVVRDHLNMMGAAPLRGWRYPDGTPAFVPMRDPYDARLRELTLEAARELGIRATEGVYAAMSGPAYETAAEVDFLRQAGATVVGMSLVPEVVPARALGMRVLGLCSVTNALGHDVSHEEVVRVSNETAAAVGRLLVDVFPRLPPDEGA